MPAVLLLLAIFFLAACSGGKQPADCDRFKSGDFFYTIKPEGYRVVINRRDSLQSEYNRHADSVTGHVIKWTGPCEYELTKVYKARKQSKESGKPQNVIEYGRSTPLKTRILKTTADYYVFESWKEGIDFIYQDTIWILK